MAGFLLARRWSSSRFTSCAGIAYRSNAGDADQACPEPVGRKAQDAEQIAHLLALEQAAEMKDGNAAIFERLGDLVQPVIRAAEDGLIAKDDAARLQFSNARGDTGGLIGRIVERAQFGLRLTDAALGLQGQVRELCGNGMPAEKPPNASSTFWVDR